MAAADTSPDTLNGLEDRIVKAVQTVSRLKAERDSLQKELHDAKEELETMRAERTQVRSRIEKLLGQLDQLSL